MFIKPQPYDKQGPHVQFGSFNTDMRFISRSIALEPVTTPSKLPANELPATENDYFNTKIPDDKALKIIAQRIDTFKAMSELAVEPKYAIAKGQINFKVNCPDSDNNLRMTQLKQALETPVTQPPSLEVALPSKKSKKKTAPKKQSLPLTYSDKWQVLFKSQPNESKSNHNVLGFQINCIV